MKELDCYLVSFLLFVIVPESLAGHLSISVFITTICYPVDFLKNIFQLFLLPKGLRAFVLS